ncbi:sugar ABC transporter permease [Staphylococcus succinus]|uniref:sugar ABC transporter permease n=1 Tax=Staphylococcus succinus TaxID=61015 RepID=UPI001C03A3A5|nr:sugar ABC transporter permease [Staphylococcus succinus]MBU0439116.1 sugar ABC transporter permease [Staphylococcus succinus]
MIDSVINFYKNIPYLFKHAYRRLKTQWMWLAIPFIASLLLMFLMMLIFKLNDTEEIKQARGYFRLAGITSFAYIWIAIYQSYIIYKKDYLIGKLYNINPIFQNIVIATITSITMFISLVIIIFATPVNIESSIPSTLYYVVMTLIFIVVVSTILGLLTIKYTKINAMYFVGSFITFFIVPILFIPKTNETIVSHILMLNPVFYLIQGITQSVVLGALSLNNIPYHLYYYLFIAMLCVVIFAMYRTIANKKYFYVDMSDDTIVDNNHTSEHVEAQKEISTKEKTNLD